MRRRAMGSAWRRRASQAMTSARHRKPRTPAVAARVRCCFQSSVGEMCFVSEMFGSLIVFLGLHGSMQAAGDMRSGMRKWKECYNFLALVRDLG